MTPRHVPALDGLRGIAILLVIPHNSNLYGEHPGWLWPLAVGAHAGWIGVQLFFVLSGYLITGNLLDSVGSADYLRRFYLRRVLRILPLYYVTLLAGLLLLPLLTGHPALSDAERAGVPWLWLFLSNWAQPFGLEVSGFTHFWSLAVEEQFYLVWPFAVMRWRGRSLLVLSGVIVLVALASRVALRLLQAPPLASYVFTTSRMDALVIGAAAAVLMRQSAARTWIAGHARALLAAGAAGLTATALLTRLYTTTELTLQTFGYPLLAVALGCVMLAAAGPPPARQGFGRFLELAPLRAVGRYSYAMYVFHLPLAVALQPPLTPWLAAAGRAGPPLFAALITTLSFVAGWLSYQLLERHFLQLKSRLTPVTVS